MSAPITAAVNTLQVAAATEAVDITADVLRAHYAKRIRWAQHARSRDAADQVAAEIVRDLVASFGGGR